MYSFPLLRCSCLLSADILHALLCLKVYSWCIRGERCTPCQPTPLPSCSTPAFFFFSDIDNFFFLVAFLVGWGDGVWNAYPGKIEEILNIFENLMRTCIFSSRQILTCTSIRHVNAISQCSWIKSKGLIYDFPIAAVTDYHKFGGYTHLFSYSSGGQEYDLSFPGLKSRDGQDHAPSRGSKGESISLLSPASRAAVLTFVG